MRGAYSQALGIPGDVFGDGPEPRAVTVHRGAGAGAEGGAGRGTRAPGEGPQQQQQPEPGPDEPGRGSPPEGRQRHVALCASRWRAGRPRPLTMPVRGRSRCAPTTEHPGASTAPRRAGRGTWGGARDVARRAIARVWGCWAALGVPRCRRGSLAPSRQPPRLPAASCKMDRPRARAHAEKGSAAHSRPPARHSSIHQWGAHSQGPGSSPQPPPRAPPPTPASRSFKGESARGPDPRQVGETAGLGDSNWETCQHPQVHPRKLNTPPRAHRRRMRTFPRTPHPQTQLLALGGMGTLFLPRGSLGMEWGAQTIRRHSDFVRGGRAQSIQVSSPSCCSFT